MTRWKRVTHIGLCFLALAFLSSCGQVKEVPQGVTGVWQATLTSSVTGARFKENSWIEETTGNNFIEKTEPGFISGTNTGGHSTYSFRSYIGTPNESIITVEADRSGNRLTNITYTARRVSDNAVVDFGTGEGDYIMHPADLKTDFGTGYPGPRDLSEGGSNPVPDIDIAWSASAGRYVVSGAATNPNPLPISSNFLNRPHEDFLVRANIGGELPQYWYSSAEITANGQTFFVKTAEKKLAVVRITNAATGSYEYACPYGNYAVTTGSNYLQRRRTAGGAERVVSYLQMTDPDTNSPIALNRMNASTMEAEYLPSDWVPVNVPPLGSATGWLSEFYSGTSSPASYLPLSGFIADYSPSAILPTGVYQLRAQDTLGYEYFSNVYYDNTISGVPYVDNSTMNAVWDNASLRLSWTKPAGLTQSAFPSARFSVWIQTRTGIDNNRDGYTDALYIASIPISDAGGDTSITVPSNVYGYLGRYAPGDLVWHVQVRIYTTMPGSSTTFEVYRHYSGNRTLPGRPDTITNTTYLQLRTNADGTREYVAWAGVDGPMGWNIPFDDGTVTSVSLLDNTGTPIALRAGTQRKYGGPYWQTVGGSASAPDFGLTNQRGYNIRPDVSVGSLSPGVYTLRVASGSGTFDKYVYYPGDETLPAVSSETMSSTVNNNGSVTLSWQAPSGFDNTMQFTVVLRSTTQDLYPDIGYDQFLYAGLAYNPASASYSLTIPKHVADYARSNYASGQVKWYVETRKYYLYNGLNANVARTYSAMSAFPY